MAVATGWETRGDPRSWGQPPRPSRSALPKRPNTQTWVSQATPSLFVICILLFAPWGLLSQGPTNTSNSGKKWVFSRKQPVPGTAAAGVLKHRTANPPCVPVIGFGFPLPAAQQLRGSGKHHRRYMELISSPLPPQGTNGGPGSLHPPNRGLTAAGCRRSGGGTPTSARWAMACRGSRTRLTPPA